MSSASSIDGEDQSLPPDKHNQITTSAIVHQENANTMQDSEPSQLEHTRWLLQTYTPEQVAQQFFQQQQYIDSQKRTILKLENNTKLMEASLMKKIDDLEKKITFDNNKYARKHKKTDTTNHREYA